MRKTRLADGDQVAFLANRLDVLCPTPRVKRRHAEILALPDLPGRQGVDSCVGEMRQQLRSWNQRLDQSALFGKIPQLVQGVCLIGGEFTRSGPAESVEKCSAAEAL